MSPSVATLPQAHVVSAAPPEEQRRCPQCAEWRDLPMFVGKRGGTVRWCSVCRERYRHWETLSDDEKAARRKKYGKKILGAGGARVRWSVASHNVKTGPIPVSTTDRDSCPDACALKENGCYAEESNHTRIHWTQVTRMMSWSTFCDLVRMLPRGTLWRHNEAGDLPGFGNRLAIGLLRDLVQANTGARGFTFTHKPLRSVDEQAAVLTANRLGFTINRSADSLEQADEYAADGYPVAVVVPSSWGDRAQKTPGGRQIVVCPAQTRGLSCATCGLCAIANRKSIIAFRAHGVRSDLVSQIVRGRR